MKRNMALFALITLLGITLPACGDESGPNPGPNNPPAPTSDGGSATADSGATPENPPPTDPNACQLTEVKAYSLSGPLTPDETGMAVMEVEGKTEPGSTVTASFNYQEKTFKKTVQLSPNESAHFATNIHTPFKTIPETVVTFMVSKSTCTTFIMKVVAKSY